MTESAQAAARLYDDALAAFQAGRPQVALSLLAHLPPSLRAHPQALALTINAALQAGALDTADAALDALARQQPDTPRWPRMRADVLNRRGAQRRERGDARAALADLDTAIALAPDHPVAHFNRALVLRDLQRSAEALAAIRRHRDAVPEDPEAAALQAELLHANGDASSAQALMSALDSQVPAASDLAPRWLQAALSVGHTALAVRRIESDATLPIPALESSLQRLREDGDPEQVRPVARILGRRAALEGRGHPLRAALAEQLQLEPVPDSAAHIAALRERWSQGLDRLETDWSAARLRTLRGGLDGLSWCNFLLAYHGQDDRPLQTRYGAFLARAAATLAPALADAPARRRPGPPRVALVGSCFRECTAGVYFGGRIGQLRAAGFDVRLHQLGPARDARTDALAQAASRFRFHADPQLDAVARALRDDDADLLLYPELGMDTRLLPLAALRLARRQAMGWGHPVTSGLPTIDAAFSCAAMEPHDAPCHYRETLLQLPGLGVDYARPALPAPATRAALGLPDGPLLLVPQSAFKLHPDNDALIARIAAAHPQAVVVLFADRNARWHARLSARLERALRDAGADPARQLHWQPLCDRARFLQINAACDLMLDSLHWSGGNTSLDALGTGLPVLTHPGRFMRGRQSLAMLRALELDDALAVATPDAVPDRLAALLADGSPRARFEPRIRAGLDRLFDPEPARRALVEAVGQLCDAAAGG